jgi:chitodextrinase
MKRVLLSLFVLLWSKTLLAQYVEPSSFYTKDNSGNPLLSAWNSNERALASAKYIPFRWVSSNFQAIKFRLLYPNNYNPSKKYPLVLFLHGRGEAGGSVGGCGSLPCWQNNEKNLLWWGREMMRANQGGNLDGSPWVNPPYDKSYPAFYLVPQEDDGYWTSNQSENGFMRFIDPNTGQPYTVEGKIRLVLELVDYMVNGGQPTSGTSFSIDPNKVYVHGLSAGGGGSFDVLYRRPDLFAGAIPYSVGGDRSTYIADLMKYMSIWVWQGGQDDNPVYSVSQEVFNKYTESTRRVFKRDKNGIFKTFSSSSSGRYVGASQDLYVGNKRYTIVPTQGHGSWFDAYDHPDIFRWLFSQSQLDIKAFGDTALTGGSVKLGVQPGFAQYEWQYSANNTTYSTTYSGGGTVGSTNEITVSVPGYYKVRFRRSVAGWTNLSSPIQITNTVTDTQAPTTPTGLTASNLTTSSVTLNWTASTDNIGVTGYDVFKDGIQVNTSTIASTTYNVTGLSSGITYSFTIKAKDAVNNISPASSALAITTLTPDTQAPSVPAGLTASNLTATSFTLNWSASTDNVAITGYDVFKDGIKINTVDVTTTNFNITGLVNGTTYLFTVRAKDAAGNISATSTALSVTTPDTQAPGIPTGLSASNIAQTSFTLSWIASTDNVGVTGYDIFKDGLKINTVDITTNTFNVTGLSPLTTYSFTVKAKDAAGNTSVASANLQVITLGIPDTIPPVAPAALTSLSVTYSGFTLKWAKSTDNIAVTDYDIFKDGIKINTTTVTDTTFLVTGLSPLTTYSFTVKAKDAAGNTSVASANLQVITLGIPDTIPPVAPAALTSLSVTYSGFTLKWAKSTDNIAVTDYDIFKDGIKINTTTVTDTTFLVTGLSPLTTYSFTVKAKDAAGNVSVASTALSVTTPDAPDSQAPTTPTGLSVINVTATGLTLNWTASTDNAGVTGYDVYQNGVLQGSYVTTTANITGLSSGVTYLFTVKAKDAAGNISAFSAPLSVTTLDILPPTIPTGLTASNITDTKVTLNWIASTDNIGVIGYDVFKDTVKINLSPVPSTSFAVTGLSPLTAYTFKVIAKDATGNTSPASISLTVTTLDVPDTQAPGVPTGLTASNITDTGLILSWTASTDNVAVTGYDVYQNGILKTSVTSTTTSISGLNSASTYLFTVRAKDAAGNISATSTALSVTTPDTQAPGIPTGLSASNIAQTSFTLSWIASTDNVGVTGYDVFKDGIKINTADVTTNSLNVTGLSPLTTYSFTVKAKDAAGNVSPVSAVLSVTTASNVVIPVLESTWLLNFGGTYSSAVTNYNNLFPSAFPVATGTSYNLIKNDGTSSNAKFVTTSAISGGGNLASCTTSPYATVASGSWWRVEGSEVFSSKFTGLLTGKTYTIIFYHQSGGDNAIANYTINGVSKTLNGVNNCNNTVTFADIVPNAAGEIAFSLSRNSGYYQAGINVIELKQYSSAAPDTQAPTVPTGLTASNITTTGFTLNWTASTDNNGVAGYDIYQNGSLKTSVTTTSTAITGLNSGTAYSFTVIAKDAAGNVSASSTALSVTTLTPDLQAPSVPTGLTASNITGNSFTLSWTASTDNVAVTGYDVYQDGTKISTLAATSLVITGLSPATGYVFTIAAKDAAGNISAFSSSLPVTTTTVILPTLEGNWIVNFGWMYSTGVTNYNNLFPSAFPVAVGTSYNLIKNDGTSSAVKLVVTQAISGGGGASACNTGTYGAAASSWWRIQSNQTMAFKFTGLTSGKYYSIALLLSSGNNNAISNYTINGVTKTLSGLNNCSNTVAFTDLQPNASGEIEVTIARNGGYYESGINVAELRQYAATGGARLASVSVKGNTEPAYEEVKSNETLLFSPNPTSDIVQTTYFAKEEGNMQIIITDALGRQINRKDQKVISGENQISIDLSAQQSGIYFIKLGKGNENIVRKVVVAK